jgi:hypothetical protein
MKKFTCIFFGILICSLSFGQTSQIKTIDKSSDDYYSWITYLNEGPINWVDSKDNGTMGISFRLIITTSEIYDNIIIEKARVGEEGGGEKILSKKQVDIEGLRVPFDLQGEIAGIKFVKWITSTSFELVILGKTLLFENIDRELIQVKKIK